MNVLSIFRNYEKREAISPLNDPFKKACVTSAHFHIYTGHGQYRVPSMSASVEFENGNTKGEQKFKAEDFGVLVRQVEDFINTL